MMSLQYNRQMNNQFSITNLSLTKENQKLRHQLRQSNILIKSLRHEISILQERLSYYENQETTIHHISHDTSEEIFTQSSDNEAPQLPQTTNILDKHYNSVHLTQRIPIQQKIPFKPTKFSSTLHKEHLKIERNPSETPPKIFFNFEEDREKSQTCYHSSKNNDKKRQRIFNRPEIIEENENSAIKQEQSIIFRNANQSIFNKVRTSKPIFHTFFITGFSESTLKSEISYFYPRPSEHFEALLSLLYNDNRLKIHQGGGNKSPKATIHKLSKYIIKDTFVIPIGKQIKSQQKLFVIGCEVDDYLENEKNANVFSRYFCFITNCKFFSVFETIIHKFIEKINIIGRPSAYEFQSIIGEELEEHLKILSTKSVEENQYANFSLGNQINVFIDVPPVQESYKNLLQFNHGNKNILSMKVQMGNLSQGSLLGYLIIYMLSQIKIVLYSLTKSKISQSILNALQIIKPLEYVNPIIIAALKDQHEEYLDAPMSLILGLWGQSRRGKQKIEIFMNKKENLNGLIEKGKLQIEDGIVINLDTGFVFGDGMSQGKNRLAEELNEVVEEMCRTQKQKYKLFEKLLRCQMENGKIKELSENIRICMKNTQLFSFFNESKNVLSFID